MITHNSAFALSNFPSPRQTMTRSENLHESFLNSYVPASPAEEPAKYRYTQETIIRFSANTTDKMNYCCLLSFSLIGSIADFPTGYCPIDRGF